MSPRPVVFRRFPIDPVRFSCVLRMLCIDQSRIFATGFSFGGMMSDAVGCATADVFRVIASVAGAVQTPEHLYSECNQVNSHPIAVWMAHGDNDTVVPLSDGLNALNIFLERAQCGTETTPVGPSPCVAYQGCSADYPIHLYQFSGDHLEFLRTNSESWRRASG